MQLYRTLEIPVLEAEVLNAVGWYAARMGRHGEARRHCEAALVLTRSHRNRVGEADALDSLGYIAHQTGQHTLAIDCYQQAINLRHDVGDSYEEANIFDRIGHAHEALGQLEQARAAWRRALELYQAQHRTTDAKRAQHQSNPLEERATST